MREEIDLRGVARRAVDRLFAARAPLRSPSGGVGVDRPGAPLVTADCLDNATEGGNLPIPHGARVTPLAREEAFRRGIRLVQEGPSGGPSGASRRIAVACDHGGRALKSSVLATLGELGVAFHDLGTHDDAACDYPDYAVAVARAVAEGRAGLGIVIDGAGIGSAMAANKIGGVLAANCWDEQTARNAREHNHANVLTLGAGHLDAAAAHAVVSAFLATAVGGGRHARRVAKIKDLDPRRTEVSR